MDAEAVSASHAADDCPSTTPSASELKAQGNEAYQGQDVARAVELWNKALRRHVEDMHAGGPGSMSPLSPESMALERSLYLNLAQGYLKLEEPDKALRACQVVLSENKTDAKAVYRAAEALWALERQAEAVGVLESFLQLEADNVDAKRLLLKIKTAQKAEAKKQKAVAQRMCAAAGAFSDDRPAPSRPPDERLGQIAAGGHAIAAGLELGELAAKAARLRAEKRAAREAAAARGEPEVPPVPEVVDLDAFAAKCMARSRKYTEFVTKNRKLQETSRRSAKLTWLRSGNEQGGFDAFVDPLRDELKEIEERDRLSATSGDPNDNMVQEDVTEAVGHSLPGAAHEASSADSAVQASMAEAAMDEMD
eukprot:TRINITY_DN33412_c0_g1_i2.p1 TRINITY_DN33412_c0_g1~~TRINITY_DN33412_c0_g1_i2.p1  ORF type:complete len:365 (+),score=91.62 TRINITY_DN33412_c0_g1_i2:102-1196(+)